MEDLNCPIIPASTSELRRWTHKVADFIATFSKSVTLQLPAGQSISTGMAKATQIYIAYLAKADIPTFAEELTMRKGKIHPGRELVRCHL